LKNWKDYLDIYSLFWRIVFVTVDILLNRDKFSGVFFMEKDKQKAERPFVLQAILLTTEEKKRLSEEPIRDIAHIVERHDAWQQEAMRQTMRL